MSGALRWRFSTAAIPPSIRWSLCMAVGYRSTSVFDGNSWSDPITILDESSSSEDVSCPTASFCLATIYDGRVTTWNRHSWSTPTRPPAVGTCLVTTSDGSVITVTPTSVSSASAVLSTLKHLDCVSAASCVADDGAGVAFWNGSTWSTPVAAPRDVTRMSCTAPDHCTVTSDTTVATLDW